MVFAPAASLTNTNVNASTQTTLLYRLAKYIPLSQLWISEQDVIGRRVARYRKYYDGDHDFAMTKEMKEQQRIKDSDDGAAVNFCPTIVDTMADRCIVQSIEGVENEAPESVVPPTPPAPSGNGAPPMPDMPEAKPTTNAITKWAQDLAEENDFDIIQGDVHLNTIRDGNSYVLAEWDNDEKRVCYYVEPAWDGQTGVLMVYRSRNIAKPFAAIKVWQIDNADNQGSSLSVTTRCNIYYEDRVEKFIASIGDDFQPFNDEGPNIQRWDMVDGKPIGLPVVHFRNGGRDNYGVSELRIALPVQNSINRISYSADMSAELTGFPIYVEMGFERDSSAVTPGMVIKIPNAPKDQIIDFKKIEGSSAAPLLAMLDAKRTMLAEITRTPSPDLSGGSQQSGEFLKQLEVGLIGKVRRFTTRAGGSWEAVFDLAWRIQQAYGVEKPPDYKRFVCNWRSPEIRNDKEVVDNAKNVADIMGEKQTLRNVADVFDLDEAEIENILEEKRTAMGGRLSALVGNLPSFSNFTPPNLTGDIPPNGGGAVGMAGNGTRQGMGMQEMSY